MFVVVFIVLCVLCGYYADSKGRSFWKNVVGALLFSPLLIFIILLLSKKHNLDHKQVTSNKSENQANY